MSELNPEPDPSLKSSDPDPQPSSKQYNTFKSKHSVCHNSSYGLKALTLLMAEKLKSFCL